MNALKSCLLFVFLLGSQVLFSQIPDLPGKPGGGSKGKVIGKIHDAVNNKGVEFAPVSVVSTKDSSVAGGAMTDGGGNFTIADIKPGEYFLRVSYIGYKTFTSKVFYINMVSMEKDLGVIKIEKAARKLKEVDVVADKADMTISVDKRVFNVDKLVTNTGGTATDVLQNVPSVTVDMDGKVSLRGSANVTILIDGKPSSLTGGDRQAVLQQIPASAIDQVEVIANPSAKYDAEGMAGIINIVTKKDKLKGVNGNITAGVGTHDKYNGSVNLNNRTDKVNLYTNYTFRSENKWTRGGATELIFVPLKYSRENTSEGNAYSQFQSGKLGADFYLNGYNTLGISGTVSKRNEKKPETVNYSTFDSLGDFNSSYYKNNFSKENNTTLEGAFDYKHTFPGTKREFTASGNYSSNKRGSNNEYTSSNAIITDRPYKLNDVNNHFTTSIIQADYVHPFTPFIKIETGVKATFRDNNTDQDASKYNSINDSYVIDPLFVTNFDYKENVYAAYSQVSQHIKKFDLSAGLRAEEAMTQGLSDISKETFNNNYFSLFPSAAIKYKLRPSDDIQISFSRRVNRPNTHALNPAVDYSDTLNIRKGNPKLLPEYIQSYDLTYTSLMGAVQVMASLFYRHSDNLISMFRTTDPVNNVSTLSFQNYSSSENYGADLMGRIQKGKFNVMGSLSGFQNKINASNLETDLQSTAFGWNVKGMAGYRIFQSTNLQLTGFYMSPMKMPQSTFQGFQGIDLGVKQDLWKGKASVTINLTDVFDTRQFKFTNTTNIIDYSGFRKRESRVLNFTFFYHFGSSESNLFQRKKTGNAADGTTGYDAVLNSKTFILDNREER